MKYLRKFDINESTKWKVKKWRKTDWRPITRKSGMGGYYKSLIDDGV